jgi:DNA polymerase-1
VRLYVADFGSLFGWKYFAHREEDDGGLHGVANWFGAFCREMQPTHFVMCLDAGHERRKAVDAEYKLARKTKPKDDAMIDQLRRAPDFLGQVGVPMLRESGEEADDVVASVVTRYASDEIETIVVSSDKDLGALVGDHCRQYDPKPDADGVCKFWDVAGVTERLGVPPWRVGDFLAMAGDSSDGIKGIKGIGKVQAARAIQQTRSMAELFRKAAKGELVDLNPKSQAIIAAGRGEYDHALRLVTLRTDIAVPELDAFKLGKAVAA